MPAYMIVASIFPIATNSSSGTWAGTRAGGARKARGVCAALTVAEVGATEVLGEYANRAKLAWARLICKVYDADPLDRIHIWPETAIQIMHTRRARATWARWRA